MKVAFLFPGQGSQFIGMGRDLYNNFTEAKNIFIEIDDILNRKLSELIFNGTEEELRLTKNAQLAIMAVSMACNEIIKLSTGKTIDMLCDVVAGHSLGEYSALSAANSISLENTTKLLQIRANAMQKAAANSKGTMVALLGANIDTAEKLANEGAKVGICQIANDNGAGQIILSGEVHALDKVLQIAKDFNIRRAIKLPVSGAFHSELMSEATKTMGMAIEEYSFSTPKVKVLSNFSANLHEVKDTPSLLVKQIEGRVRWREIMDKMYNEYQVRRFIEIGPGKVLGNIAKKMFPDSEVYNLHLPDEITKYCELIN